MIFGKVYSLYFLMHLAADIYCAPSRWEPFGISALEAMISRDLVVASQTGGLQEIVLDLRVAKQQGTGLLVRPEEPELLAYAITDLLSIVKIEEQHQIHKKDVAPLVELVRNPTMRHIVAEDPLITSKIRQNAFNRVENQFRWEKTTQKLPKIYNQALKNRRMIK
jgi:starch synthase